MSDKIERKPVTIARSGAGIERQKIKIERPVPSIAEFFEEGDSQLDEIELTGDIDADSEAQTDALVSSVRADRAAYAEYVQFINDVKFFCCFVFQSEAQKMEFLQKANLLETAEYHNFDNMYLNGLEAARRLGIEIEPIIPPGKPGYRWRGKPETFRKEVIRDEAE